MCKFSDEEIDHIWVHFKVGTGLRRGVLSCFGTQWVMSGTVIHALHSWGGRTTIRREKAGRLTASSYVDCMEGQQ